MQNIDPNVLRQQAAHHSAVAERNKLLHAQMTASIAGPIVAVNFAHALRAQQEAEGVIPGQTDGQVQVDMLQPIQMAAHMASLILGGPDAVAKASRQAAEQN